MIIAVDGPAGAGKSTVCKLVSKELGIQYLDSGAIYRAITKKILDSSLKIEDYKAIEKLLDSINIKIFDNKVFINGEDLTPYIRTKEVTDYVSVVSSNVDIRNKVNELLRKFATNNSVIMDGRDIGSCVFPDADYKFYLDASVEVRAKRRFDELQENFKKNIGNNVSNSIDNNDNIGINIEEIKRSIEERDYNDKNRKVAPLKLVDDAIYIDTSDMTLQEVVDKILFYVKKDDSKIKK